jgi:apolipoprotein N-acyltransferase
MKSLWPWLCALASGVMLALCFAPVDQGGFAWFALTPLLAALWFSAPWAKGEDCRQFLLGYVTGLGYFLGSLHWLITVTALGWFALSAYLAVYPAIWAIITGVLLRPRQSPYEAKPVWLKSWNNLRVAALSAALWTGLEWVRGEMFTGFAWNSLGVALHRNLALIQISDITGVGGLSFLLVMVNVMIVITVKRIKMEIGRHALRPHYDFSLTVALVAVVFGYGVRQLFAKPVESVPVSVAAVQANVPVNVKRDLVNEQSILDKHILLSETALAMKPDLLIWPEAATPQPAFSDQKNWDAVRGIARKHSGDFFFGTVYGEYNAAALLTERGEKYAIYHKVHLVPFGEYVPLRESFPLFAMIVGDLVPDDFKFGSGPKVLEMASKRVKIGPLICFEDTLGDLARQFAGMGAQMFVTVTNDGWFLESAGSQQHFNHALFRCAETKLPMVRAANTGVTGIIDRFGRPDNILKNEAGSTFFEGVLIGQMNVPVNPVKTFYTRNGEVFSLVCLGVAAVSCGVLVVRRKTHG